jgi:REase_DpnII-MboI
MGQSLKQALPPGATCPDWLSVCPMFEADVRVFHFDRQEPFVGMCLNVFTRRKITRSCHELLADGFQVDGYYVGRQLPSADLRIQPRFRLAGRVWLLLAPIFRDLLDEDSTPKVGPVQPRADIGIPSLRLIVEAKFMRTDDPPKKMVEQIAQDASLYLVPGSKYDKLIPFIWDDSRRTEHHEEMVRGLRQIAGVVDAVIVPRPGTMIVSSIPTTTAKENPKKTTSATKK